jgi:hypothetical protein
LAYLGAAVASVILITAYLAALMIGTCKIDWYRVGLNREAGARA